MTTHDSPAIEERGEDAPSHELAYRELWKSKRGDRSETVGVRFDGTLNIVGRRRIASPDVVGTLKAEGLHFVRLLRK